MQVMCATCLIRMKKTNKPIFIEDVKENKTTNAILDTIEHYECICGSIYISPKAQKRALKLLYK